MENRTLFLLQAFLFSLLQASKTEQTGDCSSSCGSLLNIKYPFRFKSDPINCGDSQYELSCESDQPYFYLFGRKYAVIAIEYKTGLIRVVDYDLQMGKCSSLCSSLRLQLRYGDAYTVLYGTNSSDIVTYLNCSSPIDAVSFIPTNFCFNASSSAHFYAVLPSMVYASDLPPSCKVVANADVLMPALKTAKKYNYKEVHEMLLRGFELSWKASLACRECVKKNLQCDYDPADEGESDDYCYGEGFALWSSLYDCILRLLLMGRTFIGVVCFAIFMIYKLWTKQVWMDSTIEEFLSRYGDETPTRYSYAQIKKMTRGFSHKLGQGGFGSVYKGKLRAGRP